MTSHKYHPKSPENIYNQTRGGAILSLLVYQVLCICACDKKGLVEKEKNHQKVSQGKKPKTKNSPFSSA